MSSQPLTESAAHGPEPGSARQRLESRLDDLRGLGILPGSSEGAALRGESTLIELAHALADSLESTQRRVIETSIQLLSLRELVSNLLTLRTPSEVAETVALYLHKAFDHPLALVGVYEPETDRLSGWVAVRNGSATCYPFRLRGQWEGALRDAVRNNVTVRHAEVGGKPFLVGSDLPVEIAPFQAEEVDSFIIHPLSGHGEKRNQVVGVLAVGRKRGSARIGDMDEDLLSSVVDSVGTTMENVILEEDVRREEAFRQDIMSSMAAGLIAVDLSGHILAMNAAAERLTGYTLSDLRGQNTEKLDPPGGGIGALLGKTLRESHGLTRVERAVCRRQGGAFPAACTTTPLRNPRGDVYGAVVTIDDLSEIKDMEERIRALDRLAALGRFTAGIAHEIRNPLTGIGTGVQYLSRHLDLEPGQKENLAFIEREIARLNRIVEDLFRVTHPHPLRKIPEPAHALLRYAGQALGSLPEESGVTLTLDLPQDLPPVPVDPDQIHQVLLNLLKNAVEATPSGGEVRASAYAVSSGPRPCLVIEISDTGSGIDPEALANLFEPFYTKGKPNGTGLGLYVSHGIVERHGGELLASNRARAGAVFTVKLPLTLYQTTEISG